MLNANFHRVTNLSELVVYWFLLRWYSVSTPLNAFQGVSEWYLVLKVFYQNCSSKTLCYRGMFQITDSVVVQHFAKDKSEALTRPQVSLRHYITSFRVIIKLRFIKSFIWHAFLQASISLMIFMSNRVQHLMRSQPCFVDDLQQFCSFVDDLQQVWICLPRVMTECSLFQSSFLLTEKYNCRQCIFLLLWSEHVISFKMIYCF